MLPLKAGLGPTKLIPVGSDINCYTKDWFSAFMRYDRTSYWGYPKNSLLALVSNWERKLDNQNHNRGRTTHRLLKIFPRK